MFGAYCLLTIALIPGAVGDPPAEPRKQACDVGAEVPAFYVREVNGPRPHLAVCLVCKNGSRPSVLVAVRKLDAQVESLLEAVDRSIDGHRADGLRGFAIFLTREGNGVREIQPQLMTLARERKLSLPLTIPVESATGPTGLTIPPDAQATVFLYAHKRVVSCQHFRAGDLTRERIDGVVRDATRLIKVVGPAAEEP
jgi:hypothetical protein